MSLAGSHPLRLPDSASALGASESDSARRPCRPQLMYDSLKEKAGQGPSNAKEDLKQGGPTQQRQLGAWRLEI